MRGDFISFRQGEGAVAQLGKKVLRIAGPGHEFGEHARVELMFGNQNPRRERIGGVAGQDRHPRLAEQRAVIELRRDEVDADAAVAVAIGDRLLVGVQPLVFGQQRRMDVEHSPLPPGDEIAGQDAHVAGERDVLRAAPADLGIHRHVVRGAVHALVGQGEGCDAFGRGQLEAAGLGIVAGDEDDLERAVIGAAGIEQRGHVGAAARYEHGNLGPFRPRFRHYASRSTVRARSRLRHCR